MIDSSLLLQIYNFLNFNQTIRHWICWIIIWLGDNIWNISHIEQLFQCLWYGCGHNVSLLLWVQCFCFEWIILIFFYALSLLKWKIANAMTDRPKSLTIWQSIWWKCSEKREILELKTKLGKILLAKIFFTLNYILLKLFKFFNFIKIIYYKYILCQKILKQSILWYSSNSLYFDSEEVCMKSK
jgi:hypothetical protein